MNSVMDNVTTTPTVTVDQLPSEPTQDVDVYQTFGINVKLRFAVKGFSQRCDHVPSIDEAYVFDPFVTTAILCGIMCDRRVLIHGHHGTGKSTHIEQIAARLNWPCVRINLDGQVSRLDLIGKDAIVLQDGKQVTRFIDGVLPWSITRPVILCLDEYDAGRPDVMFLLQRLLESQGKLTLLDQNRVIHPHRYCRIFATANTIGFGDSNGIYHGTQPINQGQLDRWSVVLHMGFPTPKVEEDIVVHHCPHLADKTGRAIVATMVELATLTRNGFVAGDVSSLISPRTLITWGQNQSLFNSLDDAFILTYRNRCDHNDYPIIDEYYQRCFNRLPSAIPNANGDSVAQ